MTCNELNEKFTMWNKEKESFEEYCERIVDLKSSVKLTWQDIANIINSNSDISHSADYYRKRYGSHNTSESCFSDSTQWIIDKFDKIKISDILTQTNSNMRRLAREDTIKEIAADVANNFNHTFKLPVYTSQNCTKEKDGILQISDWHYGIVVDSFFNKYNLDIAKERINKLQCEVIDIINKEQLTHLNIVNLGDMIAGRIHLTIRLNSRIDVVTQTIEVSELIAQFLVNISKYVSIDYYHVSDNHSRIEPNKKESLQIETLSRITDWMLPIRLKENENIIFHDNDFSQDINTFNVYDFNVAAVHGDLDQPDKVLQNLTLMTGKKFDLILTAHLHHFSCNESNRCVIVGNGSLMGTDEYAEKLRRNSAPTQNLIILTPTNAAKVIYRITVE